MQAQPSVVALGHAIVDVLARCSDERLVELGLQKGTMTLIDGPRAHLLYAAVTAESEVSGGSAANTAAALASLGAPVEFVGKVADDPLGRTFVADIRAAGVRYDVAPAPTSAAEGEPAPGGRITEPTGHGTGRCLVLVSPDAEKTMCTSLGVAETLSRADLDLEAIAGARILYFEGYLCKDGTQPALDAAIEAARAAGTTVAMSASDPAWVDFRGDALRRLLPSVDLLVANEPEALGLSGRTDLGAALDELRRHCPMVAVTLGAEGCVVAGADGVTSVPAARVDTVVDTTGAGDSFAGGLLFGMVSGYPMDRSARIGSVAAAEVVSHLGARPLVRLSNLAAAASLL